MSVNYEWDVEIVRVYDDGDDEDNDVVDHMVQTSYAGCVQAVSAEPEEGHRHDIVLVRDDDKGRSWAYMADGKLPEYFEDAMGDEVAKVPQKFHKEVAVATVAA